MKSDSNPTREDVHGDAAVRPSLMPEERSIDVNAFPPDAPLTTADEEAMYQNWLARQRASDAA